MSSRSVSDRNIWLQDIEWLKKHTQDYELGEVLFLEMIELDGQRLLSERSLEALSKLDRVLQLGYSEPEVYSHRAWINYYYLYNYGLALEDINQALEKSESRSDSDLVLKGHILLRMGKYKEASMAFSEGSQIGNWRTCPYDYGWTGSSKVELELLQNRSLQQEFYYGTEQSDLLPILRIAAFNQRYQLRDLLKEGSLAPQVMFAVGVDFWAQLSNMSGFATKWYDTNKQQLSIS